MTFELPKGLRRVARAQWYGSTEPHVLIELREGVADARDPREVAKLMNTLYGMLRNFELDGAPATGERGLIVSKGRLDRHSDLDKSTPVSAKLALRADGNALTTVVATFDAGGESIVDEFLASISVEPSLTLDPLTAHGIQVMPSTGFTLRHETLDPVVLASTTQRWPIPPHGPSIEITFSKPPGEPEVALRAALTEQAVYLKRNLERDPQALAFSMMEIAGSPAMTASTVTTINNVSVSGSLLAIHDEWGVTTCMTRVPEHESDTTLADARQLVGTLKRNAPPLTA